MHDPNLDAADLGARLCDIADLAATRARPPAAGIIRARGDRRTRRRHIATGFAAALVVAGIATGPYLAAQPHAGPPATPIVTPSPTSGPNTPSSAPLPPPPASSATPTSTEAVTPHPKPDPTSPSSSRTVVACGHADLSISVGSEIDADTHRGLPIIFTNTGHLPCTITGYPRVTAIDDAGTTVEQAKQQPSGYLFASPGAPQHITLRPGESASATVEALAFDPVTGAGCTAYAAVLIAAPSSAHTTRLPWTNDGCADLEVHPVVPGTTGEAK